MLNSTKKGPIGRMVAGVQQFADDFTGNLVKKLPTPIQTIAKGIVNPSTIKNPIGSALADVTKWTAGLEALEALRPTEASLPENVQFNGDGTGFEKLPDGFRQAATGDGYEQLVGGKWIARSPEELVGKWEPVSPEEHSQIYQNELSAHLAEQGRADGSIPTANTETLPAPTPAPPVPDVLNTNEGLGTLAQTEPPPVTPTPTPSVTPTPPVTPTPTPTVPGGNTLPKPPVVAQQTDPAATPTGDPSSSSGGFGKYMPMLALGGLGLGAVGMMMSSDDDDDEKKKKKRPVDAYGRSYYE
jgi:hypothetical protein